MNGISRVRVVAAALFALLFVQRARADTAPPGVGVDEHLGALLPLDTAFTSERGSPELLRDAFADRHPVVLVFGYHSCPMLCGLIQGAVVDALKDAPWTVGRDFDVVVLSIDPSDSPKVAAERRELIVERYARSRPGWQPVSKDSGWHYLVGTKESIAAVTSAAGYRFKRDPESGQYAHPAAILIATPDGRIARYLYGVEFQPSDVRYGLLEASAGRSVSTLDRVLLYCVHYDPSTHRYGPVVGHIMHVGGALILLIVASVLGMFWVRERVQRRRATLA